MDLLLNDTELAHYNLTLHAKASVKTLADFILHKHSTKDLAKLQKEQIAQHPHNTILRNATESFLFSLSKNPSNKEVQKATERVFLTINSNTKEVIKHGTKKFKPGSSVFVHSISSLLFEVIKTTKQHKNFSLIALTHAPFNYGIHLKKNKELQTHLFEDLDLENAVSFADVCLFGGTTILKNGDAIVKTGTKLCSKVAKEHNVPVYVIATSWNYHVKQLLHRAEHQTKRYERLPKENITGYITEKGIIKPEHLSKELHYLLA